MVGLLVEESEEVGLLEVESEVVGLPEQPPWEPVMSPEEELPGAEQPPLVVV